MVFTKRGTFPFCCLTFFLSFFTFFFSRKKPMHGIHFLNVQSHLNPRCDGCSEYATESKSTEVAFTSVALWRVPYVLHIPYPPRAFYDRPLSKLKRVSAIVRRRCRHFRIARLREISGILRPSSGTLPRAVSSYRGTSLRYFHI